MDQNQNNNAAPMPAKKVPAWLTLITLIFVLLLVGAVIYLHFFRYALVGKSIDLGDTTSAALLLSPELAFSLAKIL